MSFVIHFHLGSATGSIERAAPAPAFGSDGTSAADGPQADDVIPLTEEDICEVVDDAAS